MAEQAKTDALALSPDKMVIKISEFAATGGKNEFLVNVPATPQWEDTMIRAAFLKQGPMSKESFATCVCVVRYADAMGLNEVLGDLYIVSGRIATTADAKIRHALSSGLIAGYKVDIKKGAAISIPYEIKDKKELWRGDDLHATVTVKVKGWDEPITYEADLRDWFNGANAAWREHTAYMFRKQALSKALGEVAPLGVDADEIPSPAAPTMPPELAAALEKVKEGAK